MEPPIENQNLGAVVLSAIQGVVIENITPPRPVSPDLFDWMESYTPGPRQIAPPKPKQPFSSPSRENLARTHHTPSAARKTMGQFAKMTEEDKKIAIKLFDEKEVRGGQGTVSFGEVSVEGATSPVVIKRGPGVCREALLSGNINSPHVVQMILTDDGAIMPRAKGSLSDYTAQLQAFLTDDTQSDSLKTALLLNMATQILAGIKTFHLEAKEAHCDIKPQNILISGTNQVMIADFGSATTNQRRNSEITPAYAAPELLGASVECKLDIEDMQFRASKADAWSFAAVIFNTVFGQKYFQGIAPGLPYEDRLAVGAYLAECHNKHFPGDLLARCRQLSPKLSTAVQSIVSGGLTISPEQRLSIGDLQELVAKLYEPLEQPIKAVWRTWHQARRDG